ncbi:metallophosphoesterase family protein [Rubeoparvulum massiliense]|uniref:metallophosphoesterase family protein n=1 Tax=Rubeoparvulum massiliense TaxID=1631346 RepID=UPI00065E4F24|nr:metallophosphoesterase [Rubeoparvulum massiliense]
MTELVIVSDTHGRIANWHNLYNAYPHHLILHAGDHEQNVMEGIPDGAERIKAVRGNCDLESSLPTERCFAWSGYQLMLVHGHLHHVKHSLLPLFYRGKEKGVQVIVFGHTHQPLVEVMDGILFINPGSLVKPRGVPQGSYAMLSIEKGRWSVKYLTDQHQPVAAWGMNGIIQDDLFITG